MRLRVRKGFALIAVIATAVVLIAVVSVVYRQSAVQKRTTTAHETLGIGDFTAEGLVRVMSDRLSARAAENLGIITEADIAELNAEVAALPTPEGVTIDTAATKYTIAGVYPGDVIPYDQEPLRIISDQPRDDFDVAADVSGVRTARSLEVMMVATVHKEPGGTRSAVTRVLVSKILPHQRAFHTAGDADLCVSSGSQLLIDGRVRTDGSLVSDCGGVRIISGEIQAMNEIAVNTAAGGTHTLKTADQDIPLTSITREQVESNVQGQLEQYGGRVRVASGLGDRLVVGSFQSEEHAGSGECPDFDGACGGRGAYYPSITVEKSTHAGIANFDVACGAAYARAGDPAGCAVQANSAIQYVPYPFAGTVPTGVAREHNGTYWKGLFPDPRRQQRCVATVDGVDIEGYHCDTAPYGYVIDMAVLGKVRGGLLSIRKTEPGAVTNNPSGYQEVIVLKNADVLYGPLTIHTDLPVYIAGNFNSYAPRPAMIQAPMITLLPADYERQLQQKSRWQVDGGAMEPLRTVGRVEVRGILRTRYQNSDGSSYYYGAVEGAPQVLGDWSNADLHVAGAVEGMPWKSESVRYSAHHFAHGDIPADVRPVQPKFRVIQFDRNYRDFEYQPPGSWSPENQPADNNPDNPRTEDRQRYAAGGLSVLRMVQIPTRLPRDSAVALAAGPIEDVCDDAECVPPPEAPQMLDLVCTPTTVTDGDPVSCTATAAVGATSLSEFRFDWGDGSNVVPTPAANGSGSANHFYPLPGDYTVRARAVDMNGNASGVLEENIRVNPRAPEISAACTPRFVKPDMPDGNGDFADCTISVTKGSYDINRTVFIWDDGTTTTQPGHALVTTESHKYASEGDYLVEMYVVDNAGTESNHEVANVTARHLPPEITSFRCEPSTVEPTKQVTCTASVNDGTTATQNMTINWGDGSSGGPASISGGSAAVQHAYHTGSELAEDDRQYTVTATVTDLAGYQDAATAIVEVITIPPTASIMCSPTAFYAMESTSCDLSSTAGTFPVSTLEVDWGEGSAYEAVSGSSGTVDHTYNVDGTYSVRVRARDQRGNWSDWNSVSVSVSPVTPPERPSVVCSPASVIVNNPTSCSATSNQGTYPIDRYAFSWDGDETAEATGATSTRSHTYTSVGTKTVKVRARDTRGNWSSWGEATVEVGPPPVAPTITGFTCSPSDVLTNQISSCSVVVSGGTFPIQGYEYNCANGDGAQPAPSANSSYNFQCEWTSAGSKNVTVTVRDTNGGSDNAATTVNVSDIPTSASVSCPASAYIGAPVTCTFGGSGDTPTQYAITWGDGGSTNVNTAGTSIQRSHTYSGSPRTVTVGSTVSFVTGGPASASAQVSLQLPPPPLVSCSVNPSAPSRDAAATLSINYDGRGVDVTSVLHVVERSGTTVGSGSRNPGNGDGTISESVPTSSSGLHAVTVTATNAAGGSSQAMCSYNVQAIVPVPVEVTCVASPNTVSQGGALGSYYCEATSTVPDALIELSMTRTSPSGVEVEHCSTPATGTGYAQCGPFPMVDDETGEYLIGATAHATAAGYSASGPVPGNASYRVDAALQYLCTVYESDAVGDLAHMISDMGRDWFMLGEYTVDVHSPVKSVSVSVGCGPCGDSPTYNELYGDGGPDAQWQVSGRPAGGGPYEGSGSANVVRPFFVGHPWPADPETNILTFTNTPSMDPSVPWVWTVRVGAWAGDWLNYNAEIPAFEREVTITCEWK